jgi:phage protein D
VPALGIHLNVLIGPTVPIPAPAALLSVITRVNVRTGGRGGSGFSITLAVGRGNRPGLPPFGFDDDPLLEPGNRVILSVVFQGVPTVVMDGLIRESEFNPGSRSGDATATIRGRDLSVVLGQTERTESHTNQSDDTIVRTLLSRPEYAQYGFIPRIERPTTSQQPIESQTVPTQQTTDLAHIEELARRHGFVFHVIPGPAPGFNTAYWGPPPTGGTPQRAMSIDMGSFTNVDDFSVVGSEQAGLVVEARVTDRLTNEVVAVQSSAVGQRVPLASSSAATRHPTLVQTRTLRDGGLTIVEAMARAQAMSDSTADGAVRATGSLSPARYGALLTARQPVDVRGAGRRHSGTWFVETVTHDIAPGSYTQQFTLAREGLGPAAARVRP